MKNKATYCYVCNAPMALATGMWICTSCCGHLPEPWSRLCRLVKDLTMLGARPTVNATVMLPFRYSPDDPFTHPAIAEFVEQLRGECLRHAVHMARTLHGTEQE